MYYDWPKSPSDLVPLPPCDGPKLEAFDFKGPQKIEFLELVGAGAHSHVLKVKIHDSIYALKLFRWCTWDFFGPEYSQHEDREAMIAFSRYAEPFNAECRAFGRLKESGHTNLAVRCFGYVLLDEEHEAALISKFEDLERNMYGSAEEEGDKGFRTFFLTSDGRPPPLRGIIKEFGEEDAPLRTTQVRQLRGVINRLHQLGIVDLDVAHRQLINGKFCDFSVACTMPHFMTNPELNPHITPRVRSAVEFDTLRLVISDYKTFNMMIHEWNRDGPKHKVRRSAFAEDPFHCEYRNLRSNSRRDCVSTVVDPRKYADLQRSKTKDGAWRLKDKPLRWEYKCTEEVAEKMEEYAKADRVSCLRFAYRDGHIFPRPYFGNGFLLKEIDIDPYPDW